ncbi:Gldg family protein [Solirhodobacter olei]|uniref:Gldg family protein n=1 Tax=Solirhodobacter olei TaxID=2493082 RepID=UPI000FDB133E|nr:Gldg family protein [Solirhodobacter olei]
MLRETFAVARKEFRGFFSSPAAYIFIGGFLAATLFIVFWVAGFFARNIADVEPMFQWMPVLMVFLAGALTMRVWAEERRAGTLEALMTTPVRPISLVFGKFLAVEALVALALVLTLPLPFTVAHLGALDWGPVIGGYVATLCLAAAYVAIGLFVSAQSDNSVISLIVTVLICAIFYFLGSDLLTSLVNRNLAQILDELGSGSRFASITRGVLDLRDIYYYISIVGVFLALNVLQLHRLRWAKNPGGRKAHAVTVGAAVLAAANLLAANFWLAPVTNARVDLTANHRYTLSDATKTALKGLQEPLVIRGYFSSKTHPLLAPLVPQLRNLLREYAAAGGRNVRVEFLNPTTDPKAAKSAAEFGIRPTPFQTANRYSSSIVNSYFDIAISYGGQDQTLGFRDLIAVKDRGMNNVQVGLANPEYAVTSAILKVTQAYRAGGDAFASVPGGVTLHAYLSDESKLPQGLAPVHDALMKAIDAEKVAAAGKFSYSIEDPEANGGALAHKLEKEYGLRPQVAGLMNPHPFWFSLRLSGGGHSVPVTLPQGGGLDEAAFKRAILTAAKHLAPGFLHTIALATPPAPKQMYPGMQPQGPQYTRLKAQLDKDARVIDAKLSSGHVPADTDVLMVMDPTNLGVKGRFAIDQFLMRGGTVVLASSPYAVSEQGTLSVVPQSSGLGKWLKTYGIDIGKKLVLDPQNASLPVPVEKQVGGFSMREIHMMPYPHFPDVRGAGLSQSSPVTASLGQLTLDWASPITLKDVPKGLSAVQLVKTSPKSWTSTTLDVTPDYQAHPNNGFAVTGPRGSDLLAVALTGSFKSAFAGKDSPLLFKPDKNVKPKKPAAKDAKAPPPEFQGVIDRSPANAKLVVVSSSSFGSDLTLALASQGLGTRYTKPVDFLQNVADWATEDPALLALRGRTQYANTLLPMTPTTQALWEYLNYAFAILGLILVWVWRRWTVGRDRARYGRILNEVSA